MDDSAAETAEAPANGRYKPGASGNPAGRPKGAKNKATFLAEEAMEEVSAVVEKLVERALAGSTGAIRQFLDRTMPMPRGCSRFELPDMRGPRGIADAQEALIIAVAAGEVPPRDAERVMNLLVTFRKMLQNEATEARYAALDAARQQPTPVDAGRSRAGAGGRRSGSGHRRPGPRRLRQHALAPTDRCDVGCRGSGAEGGFCNATGRSPGGGRWRSGAGQRRPPGRDGAGDRGICRRDS